MTAAGELRRRLGAGATLRSTFVKLPGLEIIDLLAAVGLDALIIDLEHSQLDESEARRQIRHAAALGFPALVRLPSPERGQINRLLEAGAAGVQLSGVTRRSEVEELLDACRYPPAGSRSVSLAQPAAAYGARGLTAHLAGSAPLVVVQIETARTDDPLTKVISGVDVAFAGLTDLSVDLGVPGNLDAPAVLARIDELASARAALEEPDRPILGGWIPTFAAAGPLEQRGATYLTAGSDLAILGAALQAQFGAPA